MNWGVWLVAISYFVTLTLYFQAGIANGGVATGALMAAQLTALAGLMSLIWTYILAIRHRVLEQMYGGLDKAYKIHHIIGGVGFVLVLNHPLLLVLESLPANTLSTYLIPSDNFAYTLGVLALYVLLLLIWLTLFVDLPYKLWKKTHEWMGLVIAFAGLHTMLVKTPVMSYGPLRWWMLAWTVIAVVAYIYKRFFYYQLSPKTECSIEESACEGELCVLKLSWTRIGERIQAVPGQFVFVEIDDDKQKRDEHPFSITKCGENELNLGFRVGGPFTLQLSRMKPGSRVIVRGPFGTFANRSRRAKKMVWIAGGIGVTPFVSMAREITPEQKVTLIYTTRDGGPQLLMDELRQVASQNNNFQLVEHVSSRAGRLTGEVITQIDDLDMDTYFFLCGPLPMMEALTAQLVKLGVRRKRVIYEDFNLK